MPAGVQRNASDPFALWLPPTMARPLVVASAAAAADPPPGRSPRGNIPEDVHRTAWRAVPLLATPTITFPAPDTPPAALMNPPVLVPPRPWKLSSAQAAVEKSSAPAITTDCACIVAS